MENGILTFNNYTELKQLVERFNFQDQDPNTREQMYTALGLSNQARASGAFYTLYPSSTVFDQRISFISQRQIIESQKITLLNQGREDVLLGVSKPYFKSVLNEFGAVRIGKRIYVFYHSGLVALITNNDLTAYQYATTTNEQELQSRLNFRLFHISDADDYLEILSDGSYRDKLVKDLFIQEYEDAAGNFTLVNHSAVEFDIDGTIEYKWAFSDGSTEIGNQTTKALTPSQTYVVTPQVQPKGGGATTKGPGTGGPRYCALGSVDNYITQLEGTAYRFTAAGYDPEKHDAVEWKISCDDFESNDIIFARRLCCTGPVTVDLCIHKYYGGSDSWCCGQFIIDVKPDECREKGDSEDTQILNFSNGEEWEIECLGWVEDSPFWDVFTPGHVGSRTISKRRNPGGGFENANPEFGHAGVTGEYADKNEDCEVVFVDQTSVNPNDSNTQENIDHDGARLIPADGCDEPSKIFSRHCITVAGETLCYTKNDGKLWITAD